MRSFYNKIYRSTALQGLKHFNFFLFLLVVTGLRASAATYPVTDFTDGLAINQLRGALKAADDAGGSHTITLVAGTYNLTLGEIVFGTRAQNIAIIGAGSGSTTINMTTTSQDRIFLINPSGIIANVTVSISGIKFTGGRINISSPNNCGPYGGGAILGGGPNNSLAIINCIFQNNTAPAGCGSGGAIAYNAGGTLNIDQCTFTGNLSQDANGGAVSYFLENSVSGSVSLTNSIFTNNSVTAATASGGAVFIGVQGTLGTTTFSATVTKNTFTGNTALSGVAGAIIIDNGFSSSNTVLVNYNRFTNNAAGTAPQALGMNSAQGNVDATNNWWGCNGGPAVCTDRAAIVGSGGAGTLNLSNWLQLKATATPAIVCRGGSTLVTASFLTNSAGAPVTTANLSTLIGQPINFTNPVLAAVVSGAQTIIQANGTATATFTAGTTPGAGSLNAVVDNIPNNDAIAKAAVTINAPLLTASQNNVSCFGGSNGTASITVSGSGTAPYTYDWTPGAPAGDGTASITGLAAGTYTVAVTDANSCTNTQSFTITQPAAPLSVTSSSQTNVSCRGGSNGVATVTVAGGTPGYTYSWAPSGGTGATASGLTAGTYTVTITDANACQATQSFTITQPAAALSGTTVVTNVACNGGNNGAIDLTPSGGTLPYSYDWSDGITTQDRINLVAGNYSVTITDVNGCTSTVNAMVSQPAAAVSGSAAVTNVFCNGGSNGSINLTPSGGVPPYTYDWGEGIATEDRTGLVAGTYSVTITDANNCTATRSFTITQPSALVAAAGGQTNVSCNGGANGSATVSVTGGTPGYTYLWAPSGGTAATATGLAAGTYTVTVTDANLCQTTQSFTITQPAALTATTSQTNVFCNGGTNGVASVLVSGGTAPYTYSWSPSGGTGSIATGLAAGTYTVTITDNNNCQITRSFTLTQPAALAATTSQVDAVCGVGGQAGVVVSGGTAPYTYSWSPSGGTAATATGLVPGTYTVTIEDINACTITRTFTIANSSTLAATASHTNVFCNGGANGTATVVATGGAGGYTYSWSPSGGTGATATGLTAGTYTVTIADVSGCSITRTVTITQPSALIASPAAQTNIACNGAATGSATVAVTGGTGAYTYSWAPSGGTAATASGLSAGTYTVTVTDANDCTTTQSFTITQPAGFTVTTSQTNVSCNGGANGTATVSVSGGTPGYTYSWAPSGGIGATASGLAAGTYTVTITDVNLCSTTRTFTITQPTALVAAAGGQTNVSCNGGANGSATVSVTGGTPGYTYLWAPSGGTAATATGLAAGTYTVTVTDAKGCTTTQSFTLTQPAALTATTSQTNVSCNGGSNGVASVLVSGGTAPYTYSWSSSGGAAATASGLAAGTYTVTITDKNNCQITKSFTLTEPAALTVSSITVPPYGTYTGGDNLDFTINFSQPVTVTTSGGLPYLGIILGSGTSQANYISGSGSNSLVFRYTVGATDQDPDGLSLGTISSNGGLLQYGTGCTAPGIIGGIPSTTGFIIHNPVAQTITFGPLPVKTYGDADFDINATTTSGLPLTYTSSNTAAATIVANKIHIVGAGTAVITAAQTGDVNYLPATTVSQTLTVNPKAVTITADAKTKTYGDADPALTYVVSPALVSGDAFTGVLSRVAGENTGTYAINQNTLALNANYTLTYTGADLTITKKAVTVTADAKTKIYGDADPALTYTVAPALVSGDVFTGSLGRNAGEDVGSYAINQNTLALNNNYVLNYTGSNLIIGKKPVVVAADAKNKTYGDADPVLTYTVSPALVSGDAFTGNLSRTAGEGVGNYAINQNTLALNGNYALTYTGANLSIGQKTVTITADAKSKTYGDVDPALTYTISPALVSGDAFTGTLSRATGENVGAYAIHQNTLALNNNYVLNYTTANFTIAKKAITVTAAAKTKTYGTADPAFTYAVSPALVNGDVLTGALSRTAGEDVGSYAINQSSLAHGNYAISFVAGSLTITKAAQQITWNQTLVAGCDGNTTIALTATASSGLPVNYQSGNTAVATTNGAQLQIAGPGSTMITATQPGNNNYLPAAAVQQELTSKLPAQLMVKRWDDVLVFDNSSNQYTAWQWYKNGSAINGATGQYYHESSKLNGDYYAVVKTAAGTTLQTCPVTITPGVTFVPISIFPNPVDPGQTITVKTGYSAAQLQGATIVVTNMLGAVVQTVQNVAPQTNITMPVAQGLYAIRLKLANGVTASINALVRPQ